MIKYLLGLVLQLVSLVCFAQSFGGSGFGGFHLLDAVSQKPQFIDKLESTPASMTHLNQSVVSASVVNPYSIKGWKKTRLTMIAKWMDTNWLISYSGNKLNELNGTTISVGAARSLSDNFSVGVNAAVEKLTIKRYASQTSYIGRIGFYFPFSSNLSFSTSVQLEKFSYLHETKLSGVALFSYSPIREFVLLGAIIKETEQLPELLIGMQYQLLNNIFIRTAIGISNGVYQGQLGYEFKKMKIGYGLAHHQQLGFSSTIQLQFYLPHAKK